jgi:hypothetical protein
MTRELYQRLVADLPRHAPWSVDALHNHDLDGFPDFTEIEIEMIRRNLHTPNEHPSPPLAANESPVVFNSPSEDEEDQHDPIEDDIAPQQPLRQVMQVERAHVRPELAEATQQLMETPQWKVAESYRKQVHLVVEASHLGSVAALWQELGTLFSRNKSSIFHEYRMSLVEPNPSGWPATLHPDVTTPLEWFISEE